MKKHIEITVVAAALLFPAHGVRAQTSKMTASNERPRVNGTFIDQLSGQGVFTGTIEIARFEVQYNATVAIGTLAGALADSQGNPIGRVNQQGVLPVTRVTSTCDILRVELGPGDVEMLGVSVHLERDVLGITPRDGSPHMLGSLLCASTKLLDSNPAPDAIAAALNNVFDVIRAPR